MYVYIKLLQLLSRNCRKEIAIKSLQQPLLHRWGCRGHLRLADTPMRKMNWNASRMLQVTVMSKSMGLPLLGLLKMLVAWLFGFSLHTFAHGRIALQCIKTQWNRILKIRTPRRTAKCTFETRVFCFLSQKLCNSVHPVLRFYTLLPHCTAGDVTQSSLI